MREAHCATRHPNSLLLYVCQAPRCVVSPMCCSACVSCSLRLMKGSGQDVYIAAFVRNCAQALPGHCVLRRLRQTAERIEDGTRT